MEIYTTVNNIEKAKKEIYEKYGFEYRDEFIEHYQDEFRMEKEDTIHIPASMLDDCIQFGFDFGFNAGYSQASQSNL